MKTAIFLGTLLACATAVLSLKLANPEDAQQRYYRAHNEVERIAFRKDGSDEMRKAVTDERIAEKNLFVARDLGRRMVGLSAGFSGATLLLSAWALMRNQTAGKS